MESIVTRRRFLASAAAAAAALAMRRPHAMAAAESGLKKALVISMLPKNLTTLERFRLARKVGFEGVEAQTAEDPALVDEILAASKETGLTVHSVMNMSHWKFPLSSADPAAVEKSIQGMETSLRNAKHWGAGAVLLVPAVVNPETPYREAYGRSRKQVRKLLPLAKELGVVIAVENVWNRFLLSPLEFAEYVDSFDSPWLRAYFDVGNILLYGYPQDWIRTLDKRIVRIHLKDFKSDTKQFVPLREGSVNWPEVRKALSEIGYGGFLTAELQEGDEPYLAEVVRRIEAIERGA